MQKKFYNLTLPEMKLYLKKVELGKIKIDPIRENFDSMNPDDFLTHLLTIESSPKRFTPQSMSMTDAINLFVQSGLDSKLLLQIIPLEYLNDSRFVTALIKYDKVYACSNPKLRDENRDFASFAIDQIQEYAIDALQGSKVLADENFVLEELIKKRKVLKDDRFVEDKALETKIAYLLMNFSDEKIQNNSILKDISDLINIKYTLPIYSVGKKMKIEKEIRRLADMMKGIESYEKQ